MQNQSAIKILVSRALSEAGMTVRTVFHSGREMKTVTSFFAGDTWELVRMQVSSDELSMVLVNEAKGTSVMLWTEPGLAEAWVSLLQNRASRLPGGRERVHLDLSRTMLWMESGIYQLGTVQACHRVNKPHPSQGSGHLH